MKRQLGIITAVIGIRPLPVSGWTEWGDYPEAVMFRANLQRTGVYDTRGIHEFTGLK